MPAPRKKPGPSRIPTEAEILDAALALLDAGGPEAASIRRIAAALGVAPNAVYTYFPEGSAVIRAVVERMLGEIEVEPAATGWRAGIEAFAVAFRARLAGHPGALSLLLAGPMDGPNALLLGERLSVLLDEAGLEPEDGARAACLITVYVLGSVALEAAGVLTTRIGPGQFEWGLRRLLDGLTTR